MVDPCFLPRFLMSSSSALQSDSVCVHLVSAITAVFSFSITFAFRYNEDTATLRCSLVEYNFMHCEGIGGDYWHAPLTADVK